MLSVVEIFLVRIDPLSLQAALMDSCPGEPWLRRLEDAPDPKKSAR